MSGVASLIFYISVFLLSTFFIHRGYRAKAHRVRITLGGRGIVINPSLVIGVTIPILVGGLRQDVGTDFVSYMAEYNAAIQGGSYLEAGFNAVATVSHVLFGSPTFMFVAFSAMTVAPVILAMHKTTIVRKEYLWVFWALFLFVMFPQTFNLVRQGVAVAIGFYLMVSIIETRKLLRLSHFVCLLLAISFHASAWILVPISYVAHLLNNTRKRPIMLFILISGIVAVVCFTVLPQLLEWIGSWSNYLDKDTISRSVIPRSLLILFILMACWKFYDILRIANSYIALLWVGLLFSIGGLFVAYFERAGYYVTLLLPLLVLTIIAQAVPREQVAAANIILCIFALIYFTGVYYLMGSSDIFPYAWGIQ